MGFGAVPQYWEENLGHESGHAFFGFDDPDYTEAVSAPGRYVGSYWASGWSSIDQVWWYEVDAIRHNTWHGYGVKPRPIHRYTMPNMESWDSHFVWSEDANMRVAPVRQNDGSILVAYSAPDDPEGTIRTRRYSGAAWSDPVAHTQARTFGSPSLAHGTVNNGGTTVDRTVMVWVQNEGFCPDDCRYEPRTFAPTGQTYYVWDCEEKPCHGKYMSRVFSAYSDDYGQTWTRYDEITAGTVRVAAFSSPVVAFDGERFVLLWRNYYPTDHMAGLPPECSAFAGLPWRDQKDDCQRLVFQQIYSMVSVDGSRWSGYNDYGNSEWFKAQGEPSLACQPEARTCIAVWRLPKKDMYNHLQLALGAFDPDPLKNHFVLEPMPTLHEYFSRYDPFVTFGEHFVVSWLEQLPFGQTRLALAYLPEDWNWQFVQPADMTFDPGKVWKHSMVFDPASAKHWLFAH